MKTNSDKYVLFREKSDSQVIVENVSIPNTNFEKLLRFKTEQKRSFEPHVKSLWKEAGQKLNALSRITSSSK